MRKWKCNVCGLIHDGDERCKYCPKCGSPHEKSEALDSASANRIERSRNTNFLHVQLIDLAQQIELLCEDGIRDGLDPGCKDVFLKSMQASSVMMKLSKGEICRHMDKGKWG